jgi:hypothetical protein
MIPGKSPNVNLLPQNPEPELSEMVKVLKWAHMMILSMNQEIEALKAEVDQLKHRSEPKLQ